MEQLEALVRSGRQCILITSGSVSVGRSKLRQQQVLNSSPLTMQIQGQTDVSSKLSPTHTKRSCVVPVLLLDRPACSCSKAVSDLRHRICGSHVQGPSVALCRPSSSSCWSVWAHGSV